MMICVKKFFNFHIFLFSGFKNDVFIRIDITHIAASNTVIDDVANYLIPTYNILVLLLYSDSMKNQASLKSFNTI